MIRCNADDRNTPFPNCRGKFYRNRIDAGRGNTNQHIFPGEILSLRNVPVISVLLLKPAAFGSTLMQHERLIKNRCNTSKATGPVKGFLCKHVGVPASEDVNKPIVLYDIFYESCSKKDFVPLCAANSFNSCCQNSGIIIQ